MREEKEKRKLRVSFLGIMENWEWGAKNRLFWTHDIKDSLNEVNKNNTKIPYYYLGTAIVNRANRIGHTLYMYLSTYYQSVTSHININSNTISPSFGLSFKNIRPNPVVRTSFRLYKKSPVLFV
jgi:hypothetical protein